MPTYDYNLLVADASTWMMNEAPEFVAQVPTMIGNAETRIYRDVSVPQFENVTTGSLTALNAYFTRPTDMITFRYLSLQANNQVQPPLILIQKALGDTLYPGLSTSGLPGYYAVYDATRYKLYPTPASNYPYEFVSKRKLAALSTSNPTNFLTENFYDGLLAAVLCEACRFVLDDRQEPLLNIQEARYASAVAGLNALESVPDGLDDYRVPYTKGAAS